MPLTQPGPERQPALDARERELVARRARRSAGPGRATWRPSARPPSGRSRPPPSGTARRRPGRGGRPRPRTRRASSARSVGGAVGVQRRAERVVPARRDDRRRALRRAARRRAPRAASRARPPRPARAAARAPAPGRARPASPGPRPRRRSPGESCAASTRSIPSSAPLTTTIRSAATPSATNAPRASAASSGSTGDSPYSPAGHGRSSGSGAASGQAGAGSGLPSARSRVPAGTGAGAREELRGGRSATRVPERGRETTTPRRRSSARADATVVGDTSRSAREGAHGREPRARRQRACGDRTLDRRGDRFR